LPDLVGREFSREAIRQAADIRMYFLSPAYLLRFKDYLKV
jgi:hypothetical protein